MSSKTKLPELPLEEWEDSKMMLHLILQIIGKVRMGLSPRKNHWWYITEYITPRGFSTGPIPYGDGFKSLDITLNVHKGQLELYNSLNHKNAITLTNGVSIDIIYQRFMHALEEFGIHPPIYEYPFDLPIDKKFSELHTYRQFDLEYVKRFWKILMWVTAVMREFGGRFYGKTCPVQLYWHHMDLAITRFNGKKAPPLDSSARASDKDAYSHEVISFGFWAGDDTVREPAFYSYTYPSPEGLEKMPLEPKSAKWVENNGTQMALYTYADLLQEENPHQALLDFFESSYQAGAQKANWDIEGFRVPPIDEL
ncbi:DUF5996 family protein [Sediminitomix flava]|uniref:Ava_C0101 and related proteins n=1 Tax=Sediminitomix flava TaxID=379075 RepID=A0A315ZAE3_SEDFL|nr:DUF5996 family protein [Sediminitomix flava]PWJ41808.1 hypothetical protein BC781_10358 [Sediminitomix flava]